MSENQTILKLKKLVASKRKSSRRFQRYSAKSARFTNCFFHAVFNATNKEIKALKLNSEDKEVFKGFFKDGDEVSAIADIKSFVEKCGLLFESCGYDDKMEKGAAKIAIFFQDDLANCDFHFFREENLKTGSRVWTGKKGFSKIVKKEKYLDMNMNGMSFAGCFKITNPNIERNENKSKVVGRSK